MPARPHRRTSPIWKLSRKDIQSIIDQSASYQDIMRHLNLMSSGASVRALQLRIAEEKLDIRGLIERRKQKRREAPVGTRSKDLSEILTTNSSYCRKRLKQRLIASDLLEYKCEKCKGGPEWNGKPLVLQLDHINGVNNDNRLENLRFLCPNCHTQTENFAGRKLRQVYLCDCGNEKYKMSEKCRKCAINNQIRFLTIEDSTLVTRVAVGDSYNEIAKDYGVSPTTIRKRCKRLGIYVDRGKKRK